MPGPHGGSSAEAPPLDIHKRKRETDDGHDRLPQPPPPHSGNGAAINYLTRANSSKLPLIQDDNEAFSDILSLLSDYEGVLSRHESLAANLGAKLTAPRMLRAIEGLFEGSITVSPTVSPQSPFRDSRGTSSWHSPSWLEIVSFAKSNPADFTLTTAADGRRVCRFVMNNIHVEISEDDWRLIMSGALNHFPLAPANPLEEDETAELATLEILEQRLQFLIKQADEVARKARQLNYHLSGRKAGISSRRNTTLSTSSPGFQPVNQPPPTRAGGPNPGYDLHADLLQQFLAPPPQQPAATIVSRPPSITSSLPTPSEPRLRPMAAISSSHAPSQGSSRPSPIQTNADSPTLRETAAITPSGANDSNSPSHLPLIPLIIARIEKLAKGDVVTPACDRCRRLNMACLKHLTACQGCTRKHAKCTWRSLTEDEIVSIRGDPTTTPSQVRASAPADDEPMVRHHHPPTPVDGTPEVTEGARALRELSGRHRVGFTPTPTTPILEQPRPGSRGAELSRILLPEHVDVDIVPDRGKEAAAMLPTPTSSHRGGGGDHHHPQHSLLSHMASVATATAEARAASVALSRGSSAGRE